MSAYAQITGRLGTDPELRYTDGGTPVVNLSVSSHRRARAGDNIENTTDWFRVTVFGHQAEVISQYARKGSSLTFNGRLRNEKYTDRDGTPRIATILVASTFDFMPQPVRSDEPAGEEAPAEHQRASVIHPPDPGDDVPF